jgi:hypothetical protein
LDIPFNLAHHHYIAKVTRFNLDGASARLKDAAIAAGLDGPSVPGPIPLPRLRALAAACGVDPDAVVEAELVPSTSE